MLPINGRRNIEKRDSQYDFKEYKILKNPNSEQKCWSFFHKRNQFMQQFKKKKLNQYTHLKKQCKPVFWWFMFVSVTPLGVHCSGKTQKKSRKALWGRFRPTLLNNAQILCSWAKATMEVSITWEKFHRSPTQLKQRCESREVHRVEHFFPRTACLWLLMRFQGPGSKTIFFDFASLISLC